MQNKIVFAWKKKKEYCSSNGLKYNSESLTNMQSLNCFHIKFRSSCILQKYGKVLQNAITIITKKSTFFPSNQRFYRRSYWRIDLTEISICTWSRFLYCSALYVSKVWNWFHVKKILDTYVVKLCCSSKRFLVTVWKLRKFSSRRKKFREINSLAKSLMKTKNVAFTKYLPKMCERQFPYTVLVRYRISHMFN